MRTYCAEKKPRALAGDAAERQNLRSSYHDVLDPQQIACDIAAGIIEVEWRFLASVFSAGKDGYERAIAAGVDDAGLFADPDNAHLFRVLMIIAKHGPELADNVDRLHLVHRIGVAAFGEVWRAADDLLGPLLLESTACALERYAGLMLLAARKRRQFRRLHRVLIYMAAEARRWGLRGAA